MCCPSISHFWSANDENRTAKFDMFALLRLFFYSITSDDIFARGVAARCESSGFPTFPRYVPFEPAAIYRALAKRSITERSSERNKEKKKKRNERSRNGRERDSGEETRRVNIPAEGSVYGRIADKWPRLNARFFGGVKKEKKKTEKRERGERDCRSLSQVTHISWKKTNRKERERERERQERKRGREWGEGGREMENGTQAHCPCDEWNCEIRSAFSKMRPKYRVSRTAPHPPPPPSSFSLVSSCSPCV